MEQKLPKTLGELRRSSHRARYETGSVKDEMRRNLQQLLRANAPLFPGVIGYDDTVIPQIVNAILSRHNMILLGLRGQAKSRILRSLTTLLDEWTPAVAGCEIHDSPLRPLCRACRDQASQQGDELPIRFLHREERYVEKLATPDVTIADIIGDVDPIRAVKGGLALSDELTIHYGLLPRANRGIFAINELPDLAGKIQVGLFNVLQEGDIQIKGYPVRLPLDVVLVFSANPEDYTARGKIITPLKDRIGSEIRTHYPRSLNDAMAITRQEAWTTRDSGPECHVPDFVAEVIEEIAFAARSDPRVDRRSGVSQRLPITCLENAVSNAERRALLHHEKKPVARVGDIYSALPSLTGKLELEYEGEQRGADQIARDLIRAAVAAVFKRRCTGKDFQRIVDWFELGGTMKVPNDAGMRDCYTLFGGIQGLVESARDILGSGNGDERIVSAAEFILEGLYAEKRIDRSEDQTFQASGRAANDRPFERMGGGRKQWN